MAFLRSRATRYSNRSRRNNADCTAQSTLHRGPVCAYSLDRAESHAFTKGLAMRRHGLGISLLFLASLGCQNSPPPLALPSSQREFVFCHWNVENFFDDRNDGRTGQGDKEYDGLYSNDPDLLKQKLGKLTEAILRMNAGKGPDILAIVEVESVRAAELLQQALNAKLTDPALHYQHVVMKEVSVGRHIAPAILTRLPVIKDRTRMLDKTSRIVVAHLKVNESELVVIASHWTSRLQESGKAGRAKYADRIYGAANAMFKSNPNADFLISGDFNDDPDDDAVVNHLNAVGDRNLVRAGEPLKLYNVLAGKDAKEHGTHYYKQWHIFDQVVLSPGMLDDKGWTCDPDSMRVGNDCIAPRTSRSAPGASAAPTKRRNAGIAITSRLP